VQNMTPGTTLDQFKAWISYAKAHNYWLVIVYHEVQPDTAPRCANTEADPDPCLGDFDTKISEFKNQLNALSTAGLGTDVVTVQQALDAIDAETHGPAAGTVKISPTAPTTNATLTANPSGFTDPDKDALTYTYTWKVNGVAIAGATGSTFDLSQAGHGDAGDTITVDVTARDPAGHVTTGVSDSVKIGRTPDPVVTPDPGTTPGPGVTPGTVVTPGPTPNTPPPPVASVDRKAPKIVVAAPKARRYKVGQTLRIKLSATDDSGFAKWTATIRRSGGKSRAVKQGTKVRLSRTGSYVLRVTAKDRSGNLATKTVHFRVVRK